MIIFDAKHKKMNIITQDNKLADIVRKEFMLFSILHRLGINMAYDNLTIRQACDRNNIDLNLFLLIVNTYVSPEYTPRDEVLNFSLKDLIDFLGKSHEAFKYDYLPTMKNLFLKIRELDPTCGIEMVNDVYMKAQSMFVKHINYENKEVFPYVIDVCINKSKALNRDILDFINSSEHAEHSQFNEELCDLVSIFIKYVRPTCHAEMATLVGVLTSFSRDLAHHMAVENKYLYPRIYKQLHG